MTTTRAKEKGPATVGAVPGHGSTTPKDETMNNATITTTLPEAAMLCDEIDSILDEVNAIKHELRLLTKDLACIFNPERARSDHKGVLTFSLTHESIDAITWLGDDAGRRVRALADRLEKRGAELDAAIVAAERRAAA